MAERISVLAGRRVLIVDDETYVAMMIESMLEDLGCSVTGAAQSLQQGLAAAAAGGFDVAVLDVNLGGQMVTPLAEALAEAGVPFLFSTGYGSVGLPPEWRNRPVLAKPFGVPDLERALSEALGAS